MESTSASTRAASAGTVVPLVTVRYWAAARAAAGRPEEVVPGNTVAEVLDAVRRAHAGDPRFLQVLNVSSLLLGDIPLGSQVLPDVVVDHGDVIEVLPPFAGG